MNNLSRSRIATPRPFDRGGRLTGAIAARALTDGLTPPAKGKILVHGQRRDDSPQAASPSDGVERYFWSDAPEATAKWNLAILGVQPSLLRELTGRLQDFERITNLVNRELKAAYGSAAAKGESAESVLDRALASLERLTEVADDLNRRVDELLKKT